MANLTNSPKIHFFFMSSLPPLFCSPSPRLSPVAHHGACGSPPVIFGSHRKVRVLAHRALLPVSSVSCRVFARVKLAIFLLILSARSRLSYLLGAPFIVPSCLRPLRPLLSLSMWLLSFHQLLNDIFVESRENTSHPVRRWLSYIYISI